MLHNDSNGDQGSIGTSSKRPRTGCDKEDMDSGNKVCTIIAASIVCAG